MSWLPHGPSNSGLVQTNRNGQSKTVPALATYRGRLWCLWADLNGSVWYATTTDNGAEFGPRQAFPQPGLPVIANLNGHLHAVIVIETGNMVHYLYDEGEAQAWVLVEPLSGVVTHSSPCLVAFHNRLFLAFISDGELYYAIWTNFISSPSSASEPSGSWSAFVEVSEEGLKFDGIPALFVMNGALHLLCATDTQVRDILCYSYDYVKSVWTKCNDVSEGRAARGVSATSYGNRAFLGFIEDGPGDQTHSVCVALFTNGQWQAHESLPSQSAADPPQISILNGRIHCIFNDNTSTKDLRWYSRPLSEYSLSFWMAPIPSSTPLSRITIPGTHDSCARSNIPFVRTQYLSIPQQLALGIRFLDLRLRRHDNGRLYCYHGGIPLGLPLRLPLESVMASIWTFLRGPDGTLPPTETVLVSIDNDNPDFAQDPALFYAAVAAAITATPPYPDGTPRWLTTPHTPTLAAARGRAVLLRRYQGDPAVPPPDRLGLDLSDWVDDSPGFTITTPTGVRVHLQDKWRFSRRIALAELVASKSGFVEALMVRAAGEGVAEADDDWYINFCSAVGDPSEHGEVAEAKWIAVGAHSDWIGKWVSGMNTWTRGFLVEKLEGLRGERVQVQVQGPAVRLGIVNLDYPELPEDNDLVARLIEMNF
ncbi:phosphatidylinositol-specific phospholipase [Lasiosphaeria hispida]|uniref:Phosphatidylinositol-specific phospholipase n=1 Tax=Lasiosphaeria hispida TaxID=260671 RepID=A0AAJ0HGU5_9PEZI|nr:phosphatidylinositol-specific phospholipase [Lasiosphaeria hispida]